MIERDEVLERIAQVFPFLKNADPAIREEFKRNASIVTIPKDTIIFYDGDECKQMGLVLSGSVRVYKMGESGKEITLYRLGPGESCVLTASSIFAGDSFPATAVAEEDIEAAMIPSGIFRAWVNKYEVWRNFIFDLLSKRLSSIITTVEEVAFRRMDVRVAEILLKLLQNNGNDIKITHQDIAMELGTSREVVSRILKHFEYEHLISLKRGFITIEAINQLRKKVEQSRV